MTMSLFPTRSVKGDRSRTGRLAIFVLIIILFISIYCGLIIGAYDISAIDFIKTVSQNGFEANAKTRDYLVLVNIRPPRIILAGLVGAALAVSGVLMQGLFRNPLADPGIMGVSSGAALGAAMMIVLCSFLPSTLIALLGGFNIAAGAFFGGLCTTTLLYYVATRNGRTSIATMLLAGIALGALCGAVLGLLIFIANDNQLRDITFWNLGSLAGATWMRVTIAFPFIATGLFIAPSLSRALNALSLNEAVAGHLGFPVQRVKYIAIFLVAFMCGGAVAVSGNIGFIGIIVPHILRLTIGPDHRYLIPCSALLGASLLILTDTVSRTIVAPAELPIGIITSLIGGPFFLWILLKQRGVVDQ
ncbi:iron ABC transporter permease [uncultured Bartonella sp.]|uniref:FecCD family ABC transporter permease n=1 Tax=uncultured Bartonella sp. TaxID=104108 RepID=UPI0026248E11|nr:iron ABC transporter permease [uncultured Bartonella sp.]